MENFYGLTWQVQLALASGFAAYFIGFVGIRHHHRAIEVTFWSILFSLVTTATLTLTSEWDHLESALAAFSCTIAFAIFWRAWFYEWILKQLRDHDVAWTTDDPSALFTITHARKIKITQVAVQLIDGIWLECRDANKFEHTPFGPLTVGPNGDVALYLTHIDDADGTSKELKSVWNDNLGPRITYVPADRIKQITFRHLPEDQSFLAGGAADC